MVFHRNTGFPFFCAFPEFLSRMVGMDFRMLSCVPGVFFCLNMLFIPCFLVSEDMLSLLTFSPNVLRRHLEAFLTA